MGGARPWLVATARQDCVHRGERDRPGNPWLPLSWCLAQKTHERPGHTIFPFHVHLLHLNLCWTGQADQSHRVSSSIHPGLCACFFTSYQLT